MSAPVGWGRAGLAALLVLVPALACGDAGTPGSGEAGGRELRRRVRLEQIATRRDGRVERETTTEPFGEHARVRVSGAEEGDVLLC